MGILVDGNIDRILYFITDRSLFLSLFFFIFSLMMFFYFVVFFGVSNVSVFYSLFLTFCF